MDRLYLATIWAAGTAIFFMSLIIPWGVFSRYVLGTGSQWPEPIAILLMMVFTFIGAAAAYRAGGHIAVNMLTEKLPTFLQRVAAGMVDLLMLAICGFVTWYGTRLCVETWGQGISELPWLPVGGHLFTFAHRGGHHLHLCVGEMFFWTADAPPGCALRRTDGRRLIWTPLYFWAAFLR